MTRIPSLSLSDKSNWGDISPVEFSQAAIHKFYRWMSNDSSLNNVIVYNFGCSKHLSCGDSPQPWVPRVINYLSDDIRRGKVLGSTQPNEAIIWSFTAYALDLIDDIFQMSGNSDWGIFVRTVYHKNSPSVLVNPNNFMSMLSYKLHSKEIVFAHRQGLEFAFFDAMDLLKRDGLELLSTRSIELLEK